jgi:hypothetical protein
MGSNTLLISLQTRTNWSLATSLLTLLLVFTTMSTEIPSKKLANAHMIRTELASAVKVTVILIKTGFH